MGVFLILIKKLGVDLVAKMMKSARDQLIKKNSAKE